MAQSVLALRQACEVTRLILLALASATCGLFHHTVQLCTSHATCNSTIGSVSQDYQGEPATKSSSDEKTINKPVRFAHDI
eukprot:4051871-Amphidinium_carterae.2